MTSYDDELLAIFSRHRNQVHRYLRSRTGNVEDTEDLVQEAWIKLARNSAAAIAAPIPYLMRIARSLALDHGRAENRRLGRREVADLLEIPDERPTPEKITQDRDQLRQLAAIIGELPARQRAMLTASRLQQRPHAEIARQFDVSVRTVELEIRRACDYCSERLNGINRT